MKKTLFFVYNASSSTLNKYLDAIHKIVSPKTYACDLCSLTHDYFSEKTEWRNFRKNKDYVFVFMYKDEFLKSYLNEEDLDFPMVFVKKEQEIEVVLNAKQIALAHNTGQLIDLVLEKIDQV